MWLPGQGCQSQWKVGLLKPPFKQTNRQRSGWIDQTTAWTVNDVLVDPYPLIILVDPYPFIVLKGCGSTKIIKGYGLTKTSLTVHTVVLSIAWNSTIFSTLLNSQTWVTGRQGVVAGTIAVVQAVRANEKRGAWLNSAFSRLLSDRFLPAWLEHLGSCLTSLTWANLPSSAKSIFEL